MTPDQSFLMWTMIGTAGTAIFTGLLALFAFLAWRAAADTLDQMQSDATNNSKAQTRQLELMQQDFDARQEANAATLEHLQADSAAQTRPYVHVTLEPSIGGPPSWDVVIRNSGRTTARDLLMSTDTWPTEGDDVTDALLTLMSTPQTLPPGTSIRSFWNMDSRDKPDPGEIIEGADGVKIPVIVNIEYRGDVEPEVPYSDSFRLDVQTVGATPLAWRGKSSRTAPPEERRMNDLIQSISELRRNR